MPPLYDVSDHPLLGGQWVGLPDDATRTMYNQFAEFVLGLIPPAYADADVVARIKVGIVREINFLLQQDVEPLVARSIMNDNPGNSTQYRDRYVDPVAIDLVNDAIGRQTVRFRPPGRGA